MGSARCRNRRQWFSLKCIGRNNRGGSAYAGQRDEFNFASVMVLFLFNSESCLSAGAYIRTGSCWPSSLAKGVVCDFFPNFKRLIFLGDEWAEYRAVPWAVYGRQNATYVSCQSATEIREQSCHKQWDSHCVLWYEPKLKRTDKQKIVVLAGRRPQHGPCWKILRDCVLIGGSRHSARPPARYVIWPVRWAAGSAHAMICARNV